MKLFAIVAATAVMFVSGISVFAAGEPSSATTMNAAISVHSLAMSDQQWVGKTADQLTAQAGTPTSILSAANGDKVYVYDQSIPRDGMAPDRTLQVTFDVSQDGSIKQADEAEFSRQREPRFRGSWEAIPQTFAEEKVPDISLHPH